MSFPPLDRQIPSAHDKAKMRIRASSDRVCIRIFRLMLFKRASSVTFSTRAPRQSCNWPFPSVKLASTQMSICAERGTEICLSLSFRQNPVYSSVLRQRIFGKKKGFRKLASIIKIQRSRQSLYHRRPEGKFVRIRWRKTRQKIAEGLQQERHIRHH